MIGSPVPDGCPGGKAPLRRSPIKEHRAAVEHQRIRVQAAAERAVDLRCRADDPVPRTAIRRRQLKIGDELSAVGRKIDSRRAGPEFTVHPAGPGKYKPFPEYGG